MCKLEVYKLEVYKFTKIKSNAMPKKENHVIFGVDRLERSIAH
jgi:hypothetical protein